MLRNIGGGALLIVAVAGLFWGLGMVGREDGDQLTAADTTDAVDDPEETDPGDDPADDDDSTNGEDAGVDGNDPAPPSDETPETEPATPAPDDEAEPDDESEDEPEPEDEPGDGPEPETDEEPEDEPAEPSIEPGDVSVQILDGYQVDGGAAASAVENELSEAGYDIIARNPALRYDVTTVLWTSGNEDAARQVAAAIGAAEVREQPGTLSDAVAVHVVVGADRG